MTDPVLALVARAGNATREARDGIAARMAALAADLGTEQAAAR